MNAIFDVVGDASRIHKWPYSVIIAMAVSHLEAMQYTEGEIASMLERPRDKSYREACVCANCGFDNLAAVKGTDKHPDYTAEVN